MDLWPDSIMSPPARNQESATVSDVSILRLILQADQVTIRRIAEVVLRIRHSQRERAHQSSYRDDVHLFGACAILWTRQDCRNCANLRIDGETLRHVSSLHPGLQGVPVPLCGRLLLSELGNERIACAVPGRSCAAPNASSRSNL